MTARRRDVNLCKRRARFAIEPRCAIVRFCTGFLAVIAAHAQRFVNQQYVGRFAQSLLHQKRDKVAGIRFRFHRLIHLDMFHR